MNEYEFSLILANEPELTNEMADRLFSAGCDDASPGSSCGVTRVVFDRQANSLEAAIRSAIANVQAAGYVVARVEFEPRQIVASA